MKSMSRLFSVAMILSLAILTVGCGTSNSGQEIIGAKQALELLKSDNVVIELLKYLIQLYMIKNM